MKHKIISFKQSFYKIKNTTYGSFPVVSKKALNIDEEINLIEQGIFKSFRLAGLPENFWDLAYKKWDISAFPLKRYCSKYISSIVFTDKIIATTDTGKNVPLLGHSELAGYQIGSTISVSFVYYDKEFNKQYFLKDPVQLFAVILHEAFHGQVAYYDIGISLEAEERLAYIITEGIYEDFLPYADIENKENILNELNRVKGRIRYFNRCLGYKDEDRSLHNSIEEKLIKAQDLPSQIEKYFG